MDFTTQGGKIYRPRPKAEVCKFLPPRVVKSIDDRADVRQCYSHVRHYMKESQGLHWTLIENLAIYMKFILNSFLLQSFTELFFIGLNSIQRSQSKCAPASICRPISIQLKVDVVNVNRRSAPAFWSTDQSGGSRLFRLKPASLLQLNQNVNIYQRKSERLRLLKKFVKLKLLVINDTPKIHLRSLGSVNFIDDWLVHEFPSIWRNFCQNLVCQQKFTTRISCSVPLGNNFS